MKKLTTIGLLFLVACAGPTGPSGSNGVDGKPGTPGKDGQAAPAVVPVQFCPGYTTTYPTTFAEVGFKIGGKIYAVYWNGQAALTELPPGYYTSTSTTAPCNFTINSDGSIS